MSCTGTRSGPATPTSPTGVCCWPAPIPDAKRHRGLSAFIISMKQPGVQQRPLRMINGVTNEFGQVSFDGATVPADQMVGAPGDGWAVAMTVVGHEREPSTLGYAARYGKLVRELLARSDGAGTRRAGLGGGSVRYADPPRAAAAVRTARRRRRTGSEGSLDKLLMTWVEQSVGHAALAVTGTRDPDLLGAYLYSRAQSVMGGTSQIQKNIIASRILGLGV